MPSLLAEGHEVIASQHGLDSHAEDVACVRRTLKRVSSPAVLVGHAYGGSVITAAGTDSRVAALVYIAAFAPDANETTQSQPYFMADIMHIYYAQCKPNKTGHAVSVHKS